MFNFLYNINLLSTEIKKLKYNLTERKYLNFIMTINYQKLYT